MLELWSQRGCLPARLETPFTSDGTMHIYFSGIKIVFTVATSAKVTPARFYLNSLFV